MNMPAQSQPSVAIQGETAALISMIERVCLDQAANPDKLEKMLDMQERILDRNSRQAFAADFAAMQNELPRVPKNGLIEIVKNNVITQSTPYAKLEDINDTVRPTLQKYGFGVSFSISQAQSTLTVTATLMHRLGHCETTTITLPIDDTGSKNRVQAVGSTTSYGKRYTICAILNISTGDDLDGHSLKQNIISENGPQVVNEDQILRLRDALKTANLTEEKFCRSAGIGSLAEMHQYRFDKAIAHINDKAGISNDSN